jgi:hypothetical protein
MTSTTPEPPPWTRSRWILAVFGVLVLQVLLVFWLSDRSPQRSVHPPAAPVIRLAAKAANGWLALQNPLLFGLPPQPEGFSGGAWLDFERLNFQSADWTEPPRWLPLRVETLADDFKWLLRTNSIPVFPTFAPPTPQPSSPSVGAQEPVSPPSRLSLEGGLARRGLRQEIRMPAQTNIDLVAPSCVQVLVNAAGFVESPPVLLPLLTTGQRGLPEADLLALALARAARFEPEAGESLGRLIFHWQTVPPATTNSVSSTP